MLRFWMWIVWALMSASRKSAEGREWATLSKNCVQHTLINSDLMFQFWRTWEWSRTMYAIFTGKNRTPFLTSCASVNTPSPFGSGLECVWKRKVLTALDFQFISRFFFFLFFSDMTEKQQQMKALTLFFCLHIFLCINADWTNLILHLKFFF